MTLGGKASASQPRDALGQYAKYKDEQIKRSRALAEQFQEDVAVQIKNDIGTRATHRRTNTGHLVRATLDSQNIGPVKFTSWKVGIPEWLNRSQAKYWRTFEFGSGEGPGKWRKPFVGTVLYGRFGEGNVFYSASRLEDKSKAQRYVVQHEIIGHNSYREAWVKNGWDRRVQQDFVQVLGRHFGQKYGGK